MVLGVIKAGQGIISTGKKISPGIKSLLKGLGEKNISPLNNREVSNLIKEQHGFNYDLSSIARGRKELGIANPISSVSELKKPLYNFLETIPDIEKMSTPEVMGMPGFKKLLDKGITEPFTRDHLRQFIKSKGLEKDRSAIARKVDNLQFAGPGKSGIKPQIDPKSKAAEEIKKFLLKDITK